MKTKFYKIILVSFLLQLVNNISQAQCTWHTLVNDGFEYKTPCPDVITGTTYSTTPTVWAVHSGSRALYLNFVNWNATAGTGTAAGDTIYERTITVCPDNSIRVSLWLATAFAGVQCNMHIQILDSNNMVLANTDSLAAGQSPAWTHYQSGVITPLTSTIKFILITNVAGSAGGNDLSIDDLLIEECNTLNLGSDTTICNTASLLIDAGNSYNTYLWNTGASSQTITASVPSGGTYAVGTANGPTIAGVGSPFRTNQAIGTQVRTQYLIRASELTAAGLTSGDISSLGMNQTQTPLGSVSNFSISMGNTNSTVVTTGFLADPVTTVMNPIIYVPVLGLETFVFNNPFYWDGVSNIFVNMCATVATTGSGTSWSTFATGFLATVGDATTTGCSDTSGATAIGRPVLTFTGSSNSSTYIVTVGNTSSCIFSDSIHVMFDPCAGINTAENNSRFTLYPNPAADQVKITSDKNFSNGYFILYDVSGRELLREKIESNNTVISVSEFGNGLYFYQISDGSENFKTGKLIIGD